MKQDLLFEIGTEELPARLIENLVKQLQQQLVSALKNAGLSFADTQVYATPRRLALWVKSIPTKLASQPSEKFGPYMQAALDQQDQPTAAALGFARSCGVDFADLGRYEDKRGERLYFQQMIPSRNTIDLLPEILTQAVAGLNLAQKMRWGTHKQPFVRPVRWLLALFGQDIIPLELFDLTADRLTYGHRFHANRALSLASPDQYLTLLRANQVMADAKERQALIRREAEAIAQEKSARLMMSTALLAEVTYLVEWPVILYGSFSQKFLQVPQEALISAMVKNQKYFHLVDQHNKLLPFFITVSNIASSDPEQVRLGNERVLRPRLADAEFFYQTDQKHKLDELAQQLKQLIFVKGLGSVYDKSLRVESLALAIAKQMAASTPIDSAVVKRAAQLAKADLLTNMVQEFPDLQGTMGAYYASLQGENTQVAEAIREHYMPRFAEDDLPQSAAGLALAIADKLDSLVSLCIVDKMPTGDKDPFALRRGAIGILRMILTKKLELNLEDLLRVSLRIHQQSVSVKFNSEDVLAKLLNFFYQRLKAYYKEQVSSGTEAGIMSAFSAMDSALIKSPFDFHQRVTALQDFIKNKHTATQTLIAQTLVAAAKRMHNILSKKTKAGQLNLTQTNFQPELADQEAEIKLYQHSILVDKQVAELLAAEHRNYRELLCKLTTLAPAINDFFDQVMVMDKDMDVRNNRLALLSNISQTLSSFADFAKLT